MKPILFAFEVALLLFACAFGFSLVCEMITAANTLLNLAGIVVAAVGAACMIQYASWRIKWYVR